jgi:polyferredoxin
MRFEVSSKKNSREKLCSVLKKIGPTWLSTPWRRFAQAFCLILFLVLFFYFCWPYRYDYNSENAVQPAQLELFLVLDPLVGISTALAAKALVWSLATAAIVLLICAVFPRWFCGYVCPMGTLIDLFDWSIGRRIKRFRVIKRGWWVNLRFYLLTGILIVALFGVLLSGFVAAIPVLTRGMLYVFAPLQVGLLRGWEYVPKFNTGQYVSILLFLVILGLGLLRPRFWCAYLCPSGALLSLASVFSLTGRKVEDTCAECGRCLSGCPFDAIATDFSTRSLDCTLCRSCKDTCPKQSIKFVSRWNDANKRSSGEGIVIPPFYTRRNFLFGMLSTAGAGVGVATGLTLERNDYAKSYPVRPPGSVPEVRFRSQCVRCGECLKVCPGNVLQPAGLKFGIDGIWTPTVTADFSGCKPFCNNCGQVCPTGAIRKLPLDEKRAARLGLAEINVKTCLPHCQSDKCGLCFEECAAAGYNAIEYNHIGVEYDNWGTAIADSGFLAPVVLKDKCIGCGLCQASCYAVNVRDKKLLDESAVKILAGPGKEDRIVTGSYRAMQNERTNRIKQNQIKGPKNEYLPDFLR